ncbi:MAG: VOC family protein [Chloroflexota bacterium]|nr:MAG: glyoxalase [Chloroflexota bacterium]
MKAIGLNHVSIVARQLHESVAFYMDVFGLEPVATPNFGFPVQWLRVGELQLHLFERPDGPPTYHHLAFAVDDFEALYTRAGEADLFDAVTFGHHLFELPNGIAQLYLRDPAGNLVEIDSLHAETLSPDIRANMKRLADMQPQSAENLRATLFALPLPA